MDQDFDQFLLLIGRLNYAWTNTESLLIHLIAGLSKTDPDTATVIFLTLNTSRARIDLVQRLAKRPRVSSAERDGILAVTAQLQKASRLRNKYNHCIYAFDDKSEISHTILMRIADRKDSIRLGQADAVDEAAISGIHQTIADLQGTNQDIWSLVRAYNYPA